ncbi:MAG: hypothetical protein JWR25_1343 [Noviherbaspirillum sp.]|nr:hypothetical protein [Noviherbaspirillum sp.]
MIPCASNSSVFPTSPLSKVTIDDLPRSELDTTGKEDWLEKANSRTGWAKLPTEQSNELLRCNVEQLKALAVKHQWSFMRYKDADGKMVMIHFGGGGPEISYERNKGKKYSLSDVHDVPHLQLQAANAPGSIYIVKDDFAAKFSRDELQKRIDEFKRNLDTVTNDIAHFESLQLRQSDPASLLPAALQALKAHQGLIEDALKLLKAEEARASKDTLNGPPIILADMESETGSTIHSEGGKENGLETDDIPPDGIPEKVKNSPDKRLISALNS